MGEPFFLLLCAIKQQINKGSIDAITGKARYTLNEEWLLRENIEAKPRVSWVGRGQLGSKVAPSPGLAGRGSSHAWRLPPCPGLPKQVVTPPGPQVVMWGLADPLPPLVQNLNVSFQGCGMDSLSVRAMDTDTLTQVKEKILEAFCKNVPYSQWPRAEDVDLGGQGWGGTTWHGAALMESAPILVVHSFRSANVHSFWHRGHSWSDKVPIGKELLSSRESGPAA